MNDAGTTRRSTPKRARRVERGAAAVVSQYIRDLSEGRAARLRQGSPDSIRFVTQLEGG